MRDKISEPRVQLLHPKVRDEVKRLIEQAEAGFPPTMAIRIVQGLRTIDEQNELYAQGRTKPGNIVTKAKGGSSFHNYGLAIDFAILTDTDGNGSYNDLSWDIRRDNDKDGTADWLEVVKIFEAAGWTWGGRWASLKDYPHLQKTFGFTWQQLLQKYNDQNFISGTKYVNIFTQ
jgi:peptidoglycan L-alanyl-D-glutamate endopeptidase CwlK